MSATGPNDDLTTVPEVLFVFPRQTITLPFQLVERAAVLGHDAINAIAQIRFVVAAYESAVQSRAKCVARGTDLSGVDAQVARVVADLKLRRKTLDDVMADITRLGTTQSGRA
jgi:hypothetical protein